MKSQKITPYSESVGLETIDGDSIVGHITHWTPRQWNQDGDYFHQKLVFQVASHQGNPNASTIMDAINFTMSQRHCGHDHDCCGCVFSRVQAVRPFANDKKFAIRVSGGRNI